MSWNVVMVMKSTNYRLYFIELHYLGVLSKWCSRSPRTLPGDSWPSTIGSSGSVQVPMDAMLFELCCAKGLPGLSLTERCSRSHGSVLWKLYSARD